jgi:signal transduction histidine kinase
MKDKPTILIVDDEPGNVRALQRTLFEEGYELVTAGDGAEALARFAEGEIDLVISDVMMPKVDGYELTRRLRADEKTRLVPVILVTGLMGTEERVKGIQAGCDDFISKPFDKAEVLSRARMLLKMNFYRSQLSEKEKLESILNRMEDGIIILDRDFRITRVNDAAKTFLQIDAAKPPGDLIAYLSKNFRVLYPADLPGDVREKPVSFDIEREATERVKPLILAAVTSVIREPSGAPSSIVLTVRDVTAERTEQNIKRDFIGLISHKLRTPMAVIYGEIQLLSAKIAGELNPKQEKCVERITQKIRVLNDVIDKLIVFSELSSQKIFLLKETIDLKSYLPYVCDGFKGSLNLANLQIEVQCADALTIQMSKLYFEQIVKNLLDNAVKFTDKQRISICVAVKKGKDTVEIAVSDNGPGIPPEERENIFKGFYQLERYFTGNVKGPGVGLALVKQLVEAHAGSITVESELGKGATFIVRLPAGNE